MSIWQIIILTLWIGIGILDSLSFSLGINGIIQTGIFTGIVIGDPALGLFVGGSLQLMSLGLGTYGGTSVPNYTTAAMLVTVFVSDSLDAQAAIAMYGVPIAVLTTQFDVLGGMINTFLQQKADTYLLKSDFKKIELMNVLGCIPWFLSRAIPVFIALAIGPSLVKSISEVVPPFVVDGFTIAGKMLPAVGFAMLLRTLPTEKNIQYVILGFVLAAYLGLDILGVALIGTVIALTLFKRKTKIESFGELRVASRDNLYANRVQKFTKKELVNLNVRWIWHSQIGWNYVRMQGLGYLTTMLPVIKKLYGDDPEETQRALSTHAQFFNTTPQMGDIIVGMDIAMEETDGIDAIETVAAVKTSLMGPLAGVGETFFSVISGVVFGSIAASMAINGRYGGVILWEAWYLFVLLVIRPFLFNLGYRQGTSLISTMREKRGAFTESVTVLGLTVVGAMCASMVHIYFNAIQIGDATLQLQADFFDKIMPKFPQALLIGLCTWMLGRKWMNSNRLIVLIIVLSLILSALGILIPNAYGVSMG